ncbi:MAG TPA: RNA polymerase factor sigma-54 [Burkholderiaceae bacterium]|nr:RNA polymerase factor sigma-54 [Burkholderiaceae bacterium]
MQPSLNLQTGQQLVLTPLMQRAIQFLQLSSLEYCQEVEETAAVNPFLEPIEPGEDTAAVAAAVPAEAPTVASEVPVEAPATATPDSDVPADGEWAERDWDTRASRADSDDQWDPMMNVAEAPTLRSHLMQQAGCLNLPDRDRTLVAAIIEAVAPSGYLDQTLEDIQTVLDELKPTMEELRIALRHVQAMDPVGVAARSVPECLVLQLNALPEDEPGRACALKLTGHLDLFAAREFQKLLKVLECDEQALSDATILIRKLKPHPGSEFGASEAQYVVPDVIVQKVRGKWLARINPQVVPKLRLNHAYANILQNNREGGEMQIGQQLQEARWLMRNIEQRFTTIQNVAQAILDRQSRYFDYGDVAMKALKLKDIAEALGLHESTVSRITSRKFMATPKGVLEFKHFFNSHVTTAEGQPCSSTAVKSLIRQVIATEEPGKPLSDIKVTRILENYGVKVARRTVSKYRDALKIPAVEIRKYSYRPESVSS